jgi:hypothetical protein
MPSDAILALSVCISSEPLAMRVVVGEEAMVGAGSKLLFLTQDVSNTMPTKIFFIKFSFKRSINN